MLADNGLVDVVELLRSLSNPHVLNTFHLSSFYPPLSHVVVPNLWNELDLVLADPVRFPNLRSERVEVRYDLWRVSDMDLDQEIRRVIAEEVKPNLKRLQAAGILTVEGGEEAETSSVFPCAAAIVRVAEWNTKWMTFHIDLETIIIF
ncbi:hypothetical protein FA15DRAFT_83094 [Coprinopsis marcescibilis]|uniref:Uncharacterized protein n=1 Tax=Coprinopsis marcescibilis TaxID=230819 RepID=A0A5C3KLT0_COPMA|nr:hypothetical protein FA15DRAFT_83094 [Coprinopsis marcescibilis]